VIIEAIYASAALRGKRVGIAVNRADGEGKQSCHQSRIRFAIDGNSLKLQRLYRKSLKHP